MNKVKRTSRVLGIAFLLQFITSIGSGLFISQALFVPGSIIETMNRVASNPALLKAYIVVDTATAIGIIFLGAVLYLTLHNQGETMALVALGLYLVEAALCIAAKGEALSLLRISQEYAAGGQAAYLQSMAAVAYEAMNFMGMTLHMLAFCPGAILFYYLLYQSRLVPRALSLWGLVTVLPLLLMVLLNLFGTPVSQFLAMPYIPFEFVIGVWILVRGIELAPVPEPGTASRVSQPALVG